MATTSPECRAIMKCTVTLTKEIASDVSSIANELVSIEFISNSNWEDVTSDSSKTAEEKATLLFNLICKRIELDSGKFQPLIEVLQKEKCREATVQSLKEACEGIINPEYI